MKIYHIKLRTWASRDEADNTACMPHPKVTTWLFAYNIHGNIWLACPAQLLQKIHVDVYFKYHTNT